MATRIFKLFVGCIFFGYAPIQAQVYKGFVMDADLRLPIPYAHIQVVEPAGNGSITSGNGVFQIASQPDWPQPLQVRVSAIGFISKNVKLVLGQSDTIFLQPYVAKLGEVAIVANDYERQLLRRVIAKIPDNFPVWNEHLEGHVTENAFADTLQTVPLYEAWAYIGADKPSYENRQDFGNVAVKDGGVQTFPAFTESSIRIYAGIYNVHRFDVVQLRLGPLTASNLKDYDFNRLDLQSFDGISILPIKFQSKDYTGTVFINMHDTAVQEMHVQYVNPSGAFASGTNRTFLHFKVGYSKYEGRYRLRFINYSTAFDSGERFFLENTFSIASFGLAERPIAEAQKANFYDKLIDLVPQNLAADSTQPAASTMFERFMNRVSFDYGVAAILQHRSAYNYRIQLVGPNSISGPVGAERRWLYSFASQVNIKITPSWYTTYLAVGTRESFSMWGLGLTYRKRFGFTGKWALTAGATAGVIWHQTPLLNISGVSLPQFTESDPGDKIARSYFRESQWHVTPQVGLSYRVWKNWNFRFSVSYIHSTPLESEQVFVLPRKNFFSTERRSYLDAGATRHYHTPVMFQIQLIFRGF